LEGASITISPLVYYYEAYYSNLNGDRKKPVDLFRKAATASSKYCFPNRMEDIKVLEWALFNNPDDAQAHYLLGNILYSRTRSSEAITHWERAVELNPLNAVAYRNLGVAYGEQGDLDHARTEYHSAIKADPFAGKAIVELGRINAGLKIAYSDQIKLFEDNIKVVSGYNQAITQLIELYVITGKYQEALKWLKSIHFNSWEGQYGIHQFWEQSNIRQGDLEYSEGHYEKALVFYGQSLTYPDNLEVAEQPNTIHARNNYKIGMALMKSGKRAEALEFFRKAISDTVNETNASQCYRGKAFEAIGEKKKAVEVFSGMLSALDNKKAEGSNDRERAVYFLCRSLALEGLGKEKEAAEQYKVAVELYPLVEISAFRPPRSDL